MILKEQKAELVKNFGSTANDSGKPESQIAIFTARINDLTQHLLTHKKDNHSRRGLIMLVSKRRKMLDYLAKNHLNRYRAVIEQLGIRK